MDLLLAWALLLQRLRHNFSLTFIVAWIKNWDWNTFILLISIMPGDKNKMRIILLKETGVDPQRLVPRLDLYLFGWCRVFVCRDGLDHSSSCGSTNHFANTNISTG